MRALTVGLCAVAVVALPAVAAADRNDLTLERIVGQPSTPGTFNDPTDPTRQTMYRSLMSELSLVMAPHALGPADTLGYRGFQLDFSTSFTQIASNADYWQRGVSSVSSSYLTTITVMARKGLWLPLPGFEIGGGATKLIDSNMYAIVGYAKLALHEGFHDWAIPSLALRASASHLLGTSEVELTTLALDAEVSKSFGVGGTFALDPYLGASALLTWVRGQVIDTTPNVDSYTQGPSSPDIDANTTFPDPSLIVRWRLYLGLRFLYDILQISGEFAYTFCNDSAMSCGRSDPSQIVDRSSGQVQLSLSAGFVF